MESRRVLNGDPEDHREECNLKAGRPGGKLGFHTAKINVGKQFFAKI
jgi:hypothetical protein